MNDETTISTSAPVSVGDSSINDNSSLSSTTTGDSNNEEYFSSVIKNQESIIENQNVSLAFLHTFFIIIIIVLGIALAFKIGKWIYNLIY